MITTHLALFSFFNGMGSSGTFGRSGLGGDDIPRRNPNRGWDKAEYLRRKQEEDSMLATIKQAYGALVESPVAAVVAEAKAIVQPIEAAEEIPYLLINWKEIAESYDKTRALVALWQEQEAEMAELQDEEDLLRLLP